MMEGRRVAVIGTGWGARIIAPAYAAAGCKPLLVGRNPSRTRIRATRAGYFGWSTDLESILGAEDISLVHIATPPSSHTRLCEQALRAGKNVICEKPGGVALGELDVIATASREGTPGWLMFGYELRFAPVLQQVKEVIMSGSLGSIVELRTTFLSGRYLKSPGRRSWRSTLSHGGGMLGAVGVHLLDLIRWLTGTELSVVRSELGWCPSQEARIAVSRKNSRDELVSVTLALRSGGIAELLVDGRYRDGRLFGLEVEGTSGSLKLSGESGYQLRGPKCSTFVEVPPRTGKLRGDVFGAGTLAQCRAALTSIDRSDSAPPACSATLEDARVVHDKVREVLFHAQIADR